MKAFVFVLEDNETELDIIIRYLKLALDPQDVILTAQNGQEAISLIESSDPKPSIFILDLNMPGRIKGKDVLRWLGQQPDPVLRSATKVVFSSSDNPKDRSDCLALGCTDYKTKPANVIEVKIVVSNILKDHKAKTLGSGANRSNIQDLSQRFKRLFED